MHEYSLARSLLRQVDALRHERRADRVLVVKIRIGEFAGIEPELLASAFDNLSSQSAARGACLEIQRVSLTVRCHACSRESKVDRYRFVCAHCECRAVEIMSGDEMQLESITMECSEP